MSDTRGEDEVFRNLNTINMYNIIIFYKIHIIMWACISAAEMMAFVKLNINL